MSGSLCCFGAAIWAHVFQFCSAGNERDRVSYDHDHDRWSASPQNPILIIQAPIGLLKGSRALTIRSLEALGNRSG